MTWCDAEATSSLSRANPMQAVDTFLLRPQRRHMDDAPTSGRPDGQQLLPAAGLLPLTAAAACAHLSRKACLETCCCLGIVSERTARLTNKLLSRKPWFARRHLLGAHHCNAWQAHMLQSEVLT